LEQQIRSNRKGVFLEVPKKGAKIPQQSNPSGYFLRKTPYGHLKTAPKAGGLQPPSLSAPIFR
jgi:hypothetical protein